VESHKLLNGLNGVFLQELLPNDYGINLPAPVNKPAKQVLHGWKLGKINT